MSEENIKKEEETLQVANVTKAGQEFEAGEVPDLVEDEKEQITADEVEAFKQKYPDSKFAFFYHVNDLYLYRSYTTSDLEYLNNKRKEIEKANNTSMTDDEYLAIFLDTFVCKPEKLGQKHLQKRLSAGIPHLLYDLVNHLSGFAEVNPVVL